MSDRFTVSKDKKGDWLVFDNEDFYCCYGPTDEHDAINEMIKLNHKNTAENKIFSLNKRIAELQDLAQSIIDAESADPSVRVLMYHAWVHRAKKLKGGDL